MLRINSTDIDIKKAKVSGLWSIILAIPILLLDAAVIMYGWNTFIVPTFNLPKLHLIVTMGISIWFSYLIMKPMDIDDKDITWYQIMNDIGRTLFCWFMMYAIHLFI
jgi:hypothetical protein